MKLFQSFTISQVEDTALFINQLLESASSHKWTPRQDYATSAKERMPDYDGEYLCVESPTFNLNNKTIAGIIWIRIENKIAESFNIIPTIGYQLSVVEYNFILSEFYCNVIRGLAKKNGWKAVLSSDELNMEEVIGKECLDALERFSRAANKSTGSSHSSDFKLWCQFLFLVHTKNVKLGMDVLSGWLYDNGWSDEDVVDNLLEQYQFSCDLLEQYDNFMKR